MRSCRQPAPGHRASSSDDGPRLHRHRQQHHPPARGGRLQRAAARARGAARVHANRQEPGRGRRDPRRRRSRRPPRSFAPRPGSRARWARERSWRWRPRRSATRPTATSSAARSRRRAECRSRCCPARRRRGCRSSGAARTLATPAAGHDGGDRRGRRLERAGDRRPGRHGRMVGVVPDRLRLPRRLLPALGPALGGGARGRAQPRGGHLRGSRATAGEERGGGGRARPPRCAGCSAPSSPTRRSSAEFESCR